MFTSLKDFGIAKIWCNPRQDSKYVFKPKRITIPHGSINKVKVLDKTLSLPTLNQTYHVFQIGQISGSFINIKEDYPDWLMDRWINGHEVTDVNNLEVKIYTEKGIVLPLFTCWFMYMDEKNFIIAVSENNKVKLNYRLESIYMSVYKNAYFSSDRYDNIHKITTVGRVVNNMQDILDIQQSYINHEQQPGSCIPYVNGMLVNTISPILINIGDFVEYKYDPSISKIVTIPLNELRSFFSQLDLNQKYLIHYPFEDVESIEYFDDIDFFLVKNETNIYKGLFVHFHTPSSIRMVTHRDYGIATDKIDDRANDLASILDNDVQHRDKYFLKFYTRLSGYSRSLIYEKSRIHELYKLSDSDLLETLLSSGDTMTAWRSESLENSKYPKIISSIDANFTNEDVLYGVGYNSLVSNYAKTPEIITGPVLFLNGILKTKSTVYEYDSDGLLLGFDIHESGVHYNLKHYPDTHIVEVIKGIGTDTPEQLVHDKTIEIPPNCNYRVYLRHIIDSMYTNWTDITNRSDLYTVNNGILTYLPDEPNALVMVRTDNKFLTYELDLVAANGVLTFNIAEKINLGFGLETRASEIPWLQLDIFLNGYSLIEGLHYHVKYPRIVIFDKKYLIQPAHTVQQHISLRLRGLSDSVNDWEHPRDVGYIDYGYLSNNNKYNIRDDMLLRIVVDGKLKTRDDVVFSENHSGVGILNASNGLPYMINDIATSLRDLSNVDSYMLRKDSRILDFAIENYLTSLIPEPDRGPPSPIAVKQPIYSPFMSVIIHAVVTGLIPSTEYNKPLTDNDILTICNPFEEWLDFDPITPSKSLNNRYVTIYPHIRNNEIIISEHAYQFINKVNQIYADNIIDMTNSFLIVS